MEREAATIFIKTVSKKAKRKKRKKEMVTRCTRRTYFGSRWRNDDEWLFQHALINDRFCTGAITSASRQYHFYSGCARFYATPRVNKIAPRNNRKMARCRGVVVRPRGREVGRRGGKESARVEEKKKMMLIILHYLRPEG